MNHLRFLFCATALALSVPLNYALAQDALSNGATQNEVVIANLFPPVYPPLARSARIEGDVQLSLVIGAEGEMRSANIVSGNQLLQQAALQSAQQSKFVCRECTESVSYEMVYSFQLIAKHCPGEQDSMSNATDDIRQPGVSQSGNRVIVVAERGCIGVCYSVIRVPKVRSPKCLYLWRCAYAKKGGGWQ
jgi:TonB family protein